MILISRPQQPPAFGERAALGHTALEATAVRGGFKAQRRYDFDSSIWLAALEALREASYGKCAYCESQSASVGSGDIDHYRPKHRAEGLLKGEIHPDHYWWLAYSWGNLVFCCQDCSRNKKNRFPVIGKRLGPDDSLDAEQPLLLDPYGTDEPAVNMWFEDDGTVRAISERGAVTIEVLALNRPNLVERRREVVAQTQSLFLDSPASVPAKMRSALLAPRLDYLGLRRQLLERHLARTGTETDAAVVVPETVATAPTDIGAVWIEEVDLVNFGCFHELELRFSAPGEGFEPWIVLLGANGSGKSTILRAIALALCGADARRRLAPDASRYVNRVSGARRGHVRIRFNTGDELRLQASRESRAFTVVGRRPEFALAGYGSTRLLPRQTKSTGRATGPQLTNLFDPWASLANAEQWLADPRQVPSDDFKVLASSLKTLMSVDDEIGLSRRSGRMRARMFGTPLDLDELSDGYQSLLALSLDLSLAFGGERKQGFSTENFEGMVLIDELEVHLHPEWKMRVVSDLRSVFPHLQFVATTHDPLCLRGLQPRELHVLERSHDDTVTVQQIDVPDGLDADEILTGSWFGLDTTLDPRVQAQLMQYRNLRLEGHEPDDPAIAPLQRELELTLGSYAGTSLGRVMVEAAGELVAEQAAPEAPANAKLTKEEIKERLLAHARERTR